MKFNYKLCFSCIKWRKDRSSSVQVKNASNVRDESNRGVYLFLGSKDTLENEDEKCLQPSKKRVESFSTSSDRFVLCYKQILLILLVKQIYETFLYISDILMIDKLLTKVFQTFRFKIFTRYWTQFLQTHFEIKCLTFKKQIMRYISRSCDADEADVQIVLNWINFLWNTCILCVLMLLYEHIIWDLIREEIF